MYTHTNSSICFMGLSQIFQILLHHQKRQIKPQKSDESAICHTERSWIIYIKWAPPSKQNRGGATSIPLLCSWVAKKKQA